MWKYLSVCVSVMAMRGDAVCRCVARVLVVALVMMLMMMEVPRVAAMSSVKSYAGKTVMVVQSNHLDVGFDGIE